MTRTTMVLTVVTRTTMAAMATLVGQRRSVLEGVRLVKQKHAVQPVNASYETKSRG